MSPFRYQLTISEFCQEWSVQKDNPMSYSAFLRRKSWAQDHYPAWQKVFLYDSRVDLKEYQKFETFYSEKQYEAHQDPHVKILEAMGDK